MTGRPPLPIGAHGRIGPGPKGARKISLDGERPELWLASTRYRDADGETRKVKRTGRSKSAAENALRQALADRRQTVAGHLTPDTRMDVAAQRWLARRRDEAEAGALALTTLTQYESAWRLYLKPALGGWRLREAAAVDRCEALLVELRKRKGASATKSARTVLSGIMSYAARMGAAATNPTRDCSPVPGAGRRKRVRALTRDEREQWLAAMEADPKAARWDIPDLTRFMLATGVRVGAALAVSWDEVDLDAGKVEIRWKLVPVPGKGLLRIEGAKASEGQVLTLPSWAVSMLLHRRIAESCGYPVFPDSFGGWRWPGNTGRVLREARDGAGFDWVTSHVFRKTVATVLDEAGRTPRQIADQLDHADPAMTMRAYMARGGTSPDVAAALEDLL